MLEVAEYVPNNVLSAINDPVSVHYNCWCYAAQFYGIVDFHGWLSEEFAMEIFNAYFKIVHGSVVKQFDLILIFSQNNSLYGPCLIHAIVCLSENLFVHKNGGMKVEFIESIDEYISAARGFMLNPTHAVIFRRKEK